MSELHIYQHRGVLRLERGGRLTDPHIAYHMWGQPAPDGSNVIWVCHALTANAVVAEWWPGMFGAGRLLDPEHYCIICANMLGSCYGSTGPLSIDPLRGIPYYGDFPELTIRDLVQAHRLLAAHLGVATMQLVIGGSMGGQQALQWLAEEPARFRRAVVIATSAQHSAWGVAFNEAQRMAIRADQTWGERQAHAAAEGMKAARAVALLSYRHYDGYAEKQQRRKPDTLEHPAISYQRYQGEKLARRFNAYSYYILSQAMDSHDLGRVEDLPVVLQRITCPVLVIGVSTDQLFLPKEQAYLAEHLGRAELVLIDSLYGHDGFLLETEQLTREIQAFMKTVEAGLPTQIDSP